MKRFLPFALFAAMLTGCSSPAPEPPVTLVVATPSPPKPTATPQTILLDETPVPGPQMIESQPLPSNAVVGGQNRSLREQFPVQEPLNVREPRAVRESDTTRSLDSSVSSSNFSSESDTNTAQPGTGAARVWVNSNTGVYHYPGGRWYGNTKEGYFTTEAQAIAQGHRASQR